jgi:hypothetical protein
MLFLRFCVLYLTWSVIRTLRMSSLDPTAKPSHTEASELCKELGTLTTIYMKLVRFCSINVFISRVPMDAQSKT